METVRIKITSDNNTSRNPVVWAKSFSITTFNLDFFFLSRTQSQRNCTVMLT